jgi:hypothetical protein
MSSLYFAAGAASGLMEGYLLLCRTLAHELTDTASGLLGLVHRRGGKGDPDDLTAALLEQIVSVPKHLSAEDLASEYFSISGGDGSHALPALQLSFVPPPAHANGQGLGYEHANGHGGYGEDSPRHSNGARPDGLGSRQGANGRDVLVRGAWWATEEDDLWTAGPGPIRHRRPAAARLCLSKFLMRHPLK